MPFLADLHLQPARHASLPFRAFSRPLAFDSTFTFPGEGPALLLWTSGFPFELCVPLLAGLLGSGGEASGWAFVPGLRRARRRHGDCTGPKSPGAKEGS